MISARGLQWHRCAEDAQADATCEILKERQADNLPDDPRHLRRKLRLIIRRSVIKWCDESLPTIRVPTRTASRLAKAGKQAHLRRVTFDDRVEAAKEFRRQEFIRPPVRDTAYKAAVRTLASAAVALAANVNEWLPSVVDAIRSGETIAAAARRVGKPRTTVYRRLRKLGHRVRDEHPDEFSVFCGERADTFPQMAE